jgi:hypothetical protein
MAPPASSARTHGGFLGAPAQDGRLFVVYGRLLGPLLAGYLLFDRAFAYLHLPGSPLFVGEMVLAVGAVAALVSTRFFQVPIRDEPILAVLGAFALWGFIRMVPGVATYQLDALRDAALWFYCLFAFFVTAALARSPELLDRLIKQLVRLTPWLLLWLPFAVVLYPLAEDAPTVPFTTVSVLSHKSGSSAIAALLVLGCMWLLPGTRSARSRAVWSLMALLVIALAATQNRGSLLGVLAGGAVGLAFLRNRVGLAARVVLVMTAGLGMASLLSLNVPLGGLQGREFSASQLIANVMSLSGRRPATWAARSKGGRNCGHGSSTNRWRKAISSTAPGSVRTWPPRSVCTTPARTRCGVRTTPICTSWPGWAWSASRCGSPCGWAGTGECSPGADAWRGRVCTPGGRWPSSR